MYRQNLLLLTLYRFRFATQKQLSTCLNQTTHVQTSRILTTFIKHGFVSRIPRPSPFAPTIYFLTPTGCDYLKTHAGALHLPLPLARSVRRNTTASASLSQHCIKVLDIYLALRSSFQTASATYYAKTELHHFDHLPYPFPDAYVSLGARHYFIDFFDQGMWRALIKKRLSVFYAYFEQHLAAEFVFIVEHEKQLTQIQQMLTKMDEAFCLQCQVVRSSHVSAMAWSQEKNTHHS
jgi:DNA-binding MarR family transcriptional regulator